MRDTVLAAAGSKTAGTVLTGVGLVKRYRSTTALGGVRVHVARQESLAVMGPSGSGKSALLYVLAGIVRPDSGAVPLDGLRIDHLGENRLTALRCRRFGFVFQSGQLLPELQAVENVALPLMLDGVPRRRAVAQARHWFPLLGLDGLTTRRPGQLSGGQAQRVAIAPALVVQPNEPLTDRERDVVRLVALGRTNAEIADALYVSTSTVKTHLASAQLKLDARNRVEVAAWAWRTGIVGADSDRP